MSQHAASVRCRSRHRRDAWSPARLPGVPSQPRARSVRRRLWTIAPTATPMLIVTPMRPHAAVQQRRVRTRRLAYGDTRDPLVGPHRRSHRRARPLAALARALPTAAALTTTTTTPRARPAIRHQKSNSHICISDVWKRYRKMLRPRFRRVEPISHAYARWQSFRRLSCTSGGLRGLATGSVNERPTASQISCSGDANQVSRAARSAAVRSINALRVVGR